MKTEHLFLIDKIVVEHLKSMRLLNTFFNNIIIQRVIRNKFSDTLNIAMYNTVSDAFVWSETAEGSNFWVSVYDKVEEMKSIKVNPNNAPYWYIKDSFTDLFLACSASTLIGKLLKENNKYYREKYFLFKYNKENNELEEVFIKQHHELLKNITFL